MLGAEPPEVANFIDRLLEYKNIIDLEIHLRLLLQDPDHEGFFSLHGNNPYVNPIIDALENSKSFKKAFYDHLKTINLAREFQRVASFTKILNRHTPFYMAIFNKAAEGIASIHIDNADRVMEKLRALMGREILGNGNNYNKFKQFITRYGAQNDALDQLLAYATQGNLFHVMSQSGWKKANGITTGVHPILTKICTAGSDVFEVYAWLKLYQYASKCLNDGSNMINTEAFKRDMAQLDRDFNNRHLVMMRR